ncbi:MAG: metal ABC transporter permease [Thermoproteota archaeon]|nr:metal ABC transporter permease [Thermoproteota archaeon]
MVLEILEAGFIQRALVTGVAIAIICSAVGLFLVLRRHSLFGDALSHMAFGGIAVGLFTNIYPIWTAIIVSVLAALGMTKLRQSTKVPPDAAVAVLLSSGLALGIVLVSISGGFSVDLFSFLFGSILLVSPDEVYMIIGLSAGIMAILLLLYRKFMYIAFDEEQAKVSGLPVSKLNYLFIVLASITVIASIRLVGILLISSLIVIPNITAMLFGKGFKKTALISAMISVFSVVAGVLISYEANISTGGTIVLVLVMTFLAALVAQKVKRRPKISGVKKVET